MNFIFQNLFRGFATIIPLIFTGYVLWWFVLSLEAASKSLLLLFLPVHVYFSGLGLIAVLTFSFAVGLSMKASLLRRLFDYFERRLLSIPLVKTVYGAFRDFFDFISGDSRDEFSKVVLVTISGQEKRFLGLITSKNPKAKLGELDDGTVAVYLPMSYQLGGYTLFVPRQELEEVDMPIQEAMRYILTAGVSKSG